MPLFYHGGRLLAFKKHVMANLETANAIELLGDLLDLDAVLGTRRQGLNHAVVGAGVTLAQGWGLFNSAGPVGWLQL